MDWVWALQTQPWTELWGASGEQGASQVGVATPQVGCPGTHSRASGPPRTARNGAPPPGAGAALGWGGWVPGPCTGHASLRRSGRGCPGRRCPRSFSRQTSGCHRAAAGGWGLPVPPGAGGLGDRAVQVRVAGMWVLPAAWGWGSGRVRRREPTSPRPALAGALRAGVIPGTEDSSAKECACARACVRVLEEGHEGSVGEEPGCGLGAAWATVGRLGQEGVG